jgi:hypothetical protein
LGHKAATADKGLLPFAIPILTRAKPHIVGNHRLMEAILEIFWQVCGEFALQLLFEALGEAALHSLKRKERKAQGPIANSLGFLVLGAIAGGLSLLVFPHSPIRNPYLRLLNLVLTPLAIGGTMALLGRWRNRRGHDLVKLDSFAYATVFALAMGGIRYLLVA